MENPFLDVFTQSFDFLLILLPIVIPIFLGWQLFQLFVEYKQQVAYNQKEFVLLEIIPPREIKKTPAAMELFLVALHQTSGESTWFDRWFLGKKRTWFSLEIVSLGGQVHFYIWAEARFRRFIESQLYAQFDGIEIKESADYAQVFDFDADKNDLFGIEFGLSKPDPYPIKTYVDYGLDREDKEEFRVDPITPMLEFMSSLNPGEYIWVQILVRAHKKEDSDPNSWFGKVDSWQDDAVAEINKIRLESLSTIEVEKGSKTVQLTQTEGQKLRISALEKSIAKLGFDVGIRSIYLADLDAIDGMNKPLLVASFKQFNSNDLNGFKVSHVTDVNFPWQDFKDIRVNKMKKEILEQYKDRKYFGGSIPGMFADKSRNHFVLNTEELATIFHFPGKVSYSPTLQKVESKKVGPPPNLPV